MITTRRTLTACGALLLPVVACAHPGHDVTQGFAAGLLHPLLGMDHLVAALVVGAWSVQRTGPLRSALPFAFILALLAGVLGASHLPLQAGPVEQLIAASLLVLGALLALAWRVHWLPSLAITTAFACFHGLAHGSEQPAGAALAPYASGLVVTTLAALLLGQLGTAVLQRRLGPAPLRWLGAACAVAGITLLA